MHIDTRHNEANEVAKYKFFEKLEHKDGKDLKTIDMYISAIHEFELATSFKDFRKYHSDWAISFKNHLNDKINMRTGENISKSLYFHYITFVRHFFDWLVASSKEYSKLKPEDIEYFSVSRNDKNRAKATVFQESHNISDILATIRKMPDNSKIDKRNKAILSLFLLTCPRISSLQQARIKNIQYLKDYDAWAFLQDPRLQNTKFSKTITSFFVGNVADIIQNVTSWRDYLISKDFTDRDYLFPKIQNSFMPSGDVIILLTKDYIKSTSQIRDIVKTAFTNNGLPYHKPHSFRHSIARKVRKDGVALDVLITLSENFGHKTGMAEIIRTYGGDYLARQAEIIKNIRLE